MNEFSDLSRHLAKDERKEKVKSRLDDFNKRVRRCIDEFHIAHKKRGILKNLLPGLKEKIDSKGKILQKQSFKIIMKLLH